MPAPLILDVDTGVDDMVALLLAVASPEVDLVAATCVTGNVHVDMVTRNTSLALELAGAGGVEIARGASEPLDGDWQPFPVVHGPEGLGAYVPSHHAKAISARSAATLIAQEAARRPGEVMLVATGPLTNVALALELEPALPALLGGFALMGGAYRAGGNVTPRAEANVWMDPEAAARVFEAWSGSAQLPRCVGLDVTERVWLTREDVEAICSPAPSSELATLIGQAVPFYIDFYASTGRFDGASMHDPLAVAAAIDPSVCEWTDTRVEVERAGRWTRGETVTDLLDIRHTRWSGWAKEENARVAVLVDAPRVVARLIERLRGLVSERA
jgi:purine nucleosidase